jgi:hypothetical protein
MRVAEKELIYQLHGLPSKLIRESYTGGAVDVYIPHNKIGSFSISNTFKDLWYYDANALYPTCMSQQLLPVGKPIPFDGDIRKIDSNAQGFFYCDITSPDNPDQPVLQRKVKTKFGTRTIAGLGQ